MLDINKVLKHCVSLQDREQRSMELELAIGMLTLLLASRWSLQPDFVTYLKVCLQLPL